MSEDPLFQLSSVVHELALNIASIPIRESTDPYEQQLSHTYKSLRAFLGARTAAINGLIGDRFLWDAEIILRSLSECSIKASFIFLDNSRQTAIDLSTEYFGDLADVFRKRDADRATETAKALSRHGDSEGANLLLIAADEFMSGAKEIPAKRRREIERKWGFTAILSDVLDRKANSDNAVNLSQHLHHYGAQSHVIHCNPAALGLAEDAFSRAQTEGMLKDRGHSARIYKEIASYWMLFFLIAEQHFSANHETKVAIYKNRELILNLANSLQADFMSYIKETLEN